MKRSMSKVLPGLYIGGILDANEVFKRNRYDITHVISLRSRPKRMIKLYHYTHIPIADAPDQHISRYFSLCNDIIHEARLEDVDNNILVHCYAGISRSATIVIAYLMTIANLSWETAWHVLAGARPEVRPNPMFQDQLKEFQKYGLRAEQLRLYRKFPTRKLQGWDVYRIEALLEEYNEYQEIGTEDNVYTSSSSVDVGDDDDSDDDADDDNDCFYDCSNGDDNRGGNSDSGGRHWNFLKWLSFQ